MDVLQALGVGHGQWGLLLSLGGAAAVLGMLSAAHCAAMCAPLVAAGLAPCARAGAPSTARRTLAHWVLGRCVSYAVMGALVAAVWGLLGDWARGDLTGALATAKQALHTAWTWGHAAVLAWGLTLLCTGQALAWGGKRQSASPQIRPVQWVFSATSARQYGVNSYQKYSNYQRGSTGREPGSAPPARVPTASLGWLWGLLPCPTLYGALAIAALTNGPAQGALVMAVFALCSLPGVLVPLWAWRRLAVRADGWARRTSGAVLAVAAALALMGVSTYDVWAWCVQPP